MASLLKSVAVVGLSLGITAASPAYRFDPRTLQARWTYDVCNNCSLYNVPAPDKDTFNNGPIGNWRADRTYDLCLGGPAACSVKSTVTLDFVGLSLYLNFSKWPTGYEYQEAKVFLAPMGSGYGPSFSPAPTDLTPQYTCAVSPDRTAATCSVPFSTLTGVGSSDPSVLFAAMCPLGSIEALDFYVAYSGLVKTPSGETMPFSQAYPCTNYVSGQCTAYCTSCNYAEMSYRCTNCYVPCPSSSTTQTASSSTTTSTSTTSTSTTTSSTSTTSTSTSSSTTTSSTPTPTVCSYGTAFGYRDAANSITLNTQSGNGCNRWGWYTTPTLAELQAGISGSLLVGAGGNNVGAATNVGTWTAVASPTGGVTVTYSLVPPYTLGKVHIDLDCLPIDTCAPGQYTFRSPTFPAAGLPVYANPTPLQYPTCSGGSRAYLIVHAAVLVSQASGPCGAVVAQ
ncbi:hypothetical protein RB595_001818 [Gaeumannomyces hyphopodioides]